MTAMHAAALAAILLWAWPACASASRAPLQSPAACTGFSALYDNIDKDLERWQGSGISQKLMHSTIKDHATLRDSPHSQKGFAAAFINGTAVLLHKPELSWSGHHVGIWFLYMRALLDLQQQYGHLIPDVEFVISTVDRPLKLSSANRTKRPDQPVFRFCKTDSHPDVLIPDFHFYIKGIVGYLLEKRSWLNKVHPWHNKTATLFGRFSPYHRHLDAADTYAYRLGAAGSVICHASSKKASPVALTCPVRQHFCEWSKSQNQTLFDVSLEGRLAMKYHARYKYLVHLDGQGLSSRLEQLLTLGSVVFKEESGYRGFYHSLLQPFVHYVPFWQKVPEDVLDRLEWVRQHDDEARAIASNAQQFAHTYFTRDAVSCYWLTLLTRFSQLLRYQPAQRPAKLYLPVQQYLSDVAMRYKEGRLYNAFPFVDDPDVIVLGSD